MVVVVALTYAGDGRGINRGAGRAARRRTGSPLLASASQPPVPSLARPSTSPPPLVRGSPHGSRPHRPPPANATERKGVVVGWTREIGWTTGPRPGNSCVLLRVVVGHPNLTFQHATVQPTWPKALAKLPVLGWASLAQK